MKLHTRIGETRIRAASDERGTIGLAVFAAMSYVSAGIGAIAMIAYVLRGDTAGLVAATFWTLWSLIWAAVWHQWSQKKDAEVATMDCISQKLQTDSADNAKLIALLEEQNRLLREQKEG